jgi:hypothetical protein
MQRVWDTDAPETPAERPPTPPAKPLPKWYHDLRLGGVGLVLDFGWRRTDEGLQWELEEQKHAAQLARYRRAERRRQSQSQGDKAAGSGAGASGSSGWVRSPFVDSW